MTGPWARLRIGFATLGVIFCVAVLGYRLAGWEWLDSVYMVVTTVSTVGFREMGPMTPALKVVAIRHSDGRFEVNPSAGATFEAGDTAVVIGRLADIERFRSECGV